MNQYSYDISLRVRHPTIDPAEISAALGLEPSRMLRAGDPRTTPKNTPLQGLWPDTYWTSDVLKDKCPDRTLASALGDLIVRFVTYRDFFQAMRLGGGKVEFYVGWFIDGNRGDVFDAALLARLGELGVDLSLDVYPPTNLQDDF